MSLCGVVTKLRKELLYSTVYLLQEGTSYQSKNPVASPVTLRSKCDHSEPQVKSAALTGSDTVSRLGVYIDQGSLSSDSYVEDLSTSDVM